MRPSAPPLLFWNVSASTTCSRVTFPIFVSTRPIGRPWSWSIGGIGVADDARPPPLTPTGFAPPAGTVTFDGGRNPGEGFIGAGVPPPGRTAPAGGVVGDDGFFPGSGAGGVGGL